MTGKEFIKLLEKSGWHYKRISGSHHIMVRVLRNGHTQSEIARKLGISYQVYQRLETPGKCNPTLKTMEKLSEVFGKKLELVFS